MSLVEGIIRNELKSKIKKIDEYSFSSGYFTDLVLTILATSIFNSLTEIFVYHSTLVWPTKIHDKQTLQKLYTMVYTKIASIQLILTEFISSTKSMPFLNHSNPIRSMFSMSHTGISITYHIGRLALFYKSLDMKSEYVAVIKSILNLTKEIEPYGYKINFIDDFLREYHI